jgi:hypothetical protein
VSTITAFMSLLGRGFQQRTFSLFWVPELCPWLSYQLLTATAPKYWTAAVLSQTPSPTNSFHWTDLHCTN